MSVLVLEAWCVQTTTELPEGSDAVADCDWSRAVLVLTWSSAEILPRAGTTRSSSISSVGRRVGGRRSRRREEVGARRRDRRSRNVNMRYYLLKGSDKRQASSCGGASFCEAADVRGGGTVRPAPGAGRRCGDTD